MNQAVILFEPPRPKTVLHDGTGGEEDWIEIELIDSTSGEIRTVLVNKFGLVDVQN